MLKQYVAPDLRVVRTDLELYFLISDFDSYGRNGDPIGEGEEDDDLNW